MSIQLGETLDKAKALVTEDRQAMHGDPRPPHQTIASFWSAFLRAKHWSGPELAPEDVAVMMGLFKIGREAHRHTSDNLPDLAGYADLAAYMRGTDKP